MEYTEQELNEEVWKQYKESKYEVSNLGRLRNMSDKTILECYKSPQGYYRVYVNNIKRPISLHRMIAEAFFGEFNSKLQVHHKDENKLNNRLTNLCLMTAYEHGSLHKQGEKNSSFKGKIARFKKDGTLMGFTSSNTELKSLGFDVAHVTHIIKKQRKFHKNHTFKRLKNIENYIIGQRYDLQKLEEISSSQMELF